MEKIKDIAREMTLTAIITERDEMVIKQHEQLGILQKQNEMLIKQVEELKKESKKNGNPASQ